MPQKDFHTTFRDVASISLLIAALEKSFPLFLRSDDEGIVDDGGKERSQNLFQTLRSFSTSFPQRPVDGEYQ
jgi:hypothetical protein